MQVTTIRGKIHMDIVDAIIDFLEPKFREAFGYVCGFGWKKCSGYDDAVNITVASDKELSTIEIRFIELCITCCVVGAAAMMEAYVKRRLGNNDEEGFV